MFSASVTVPISVPTATDSVAKYASYAGLWGCRERRIAQIIGVFQRFRFLPDRSENRSVDGSIPPLATITFFTFTGFAMRF